MIVDAQLPPDEMRRLLFQLAMMGCHDLERQRRLILTYGRKAGVAYAIECNPPESLR